GRVTGEADGAEAPRCSMLSIHGHSPVENYQLIIFSAVSGKNYQLIIFSPEAHPAAHPEPEARPAPPPDPRPGQPRPPPGPRARPAPRRRPGPPPPRGRGRGPPRPEAEGEASPAPRPNPCAGAKNYQLIIFGAPDSRRTKAPAATGAAGTKGEDQPRRYRRWNF